MVLIIGFVTKWVCFFLDVRKYTKITLSKKRIYSANGSLAPPQTANAKREQVVRPIPQSTLIQPKRS